MKQYFSFQWHITDECDQRCKHCYIFSEDNCKNLDSMTWEKMQDTFQNCLDFCRIYDRLPEECLKDMFNVLMREKLDVSEFWNFETKVKTSALGKKYFGIT